MKRTTSLNFYATEAAAIDAATSRTKAHAKGDRTVFVVVAGPSDNWACCDLRTAIEMAQPYRWFT